MISNQYRVQISPDFTDLYPEASPKATETAMNLVRTADLLVKRIAELVQPFDLSPSSGLVLGILADSGDPLPPNQIAERLIISRASATSLLDTLERRGYVRRKPHPEDRRMLLIELTDAGRQVAYEFRSVVHQHEKDWFAGFSEGELEQLINAVHRLQVAITKPKP